MGRGACPPTTRLPWRSSPSCLQRWRLILTWRTLPGQLVGDLSGPSAHSVSFERAVERRWTRRAFESIRTVLGRRYEGLRGLAPVRPARPLHPTGWGSPGGDGGASALPRARLKARRAETRQAWLPPARSQGGRGAGSREPRFPGLYGPHSGENPSGPAPGRAWEGSSGVTECPHRSPGRAPGRRWCPRAPSGGRPETPDTPISPAPRSARPSSRPECQEC